ncbi:MAG TPA: ribose-phosphate diphosphokinase [Steroidobacteraceae bacterium]|nr:ribose-phosphate diphosphokinase [Steroidobacteraceae bacterium]
MSAVCFSFAQDAHIGRSLARAIGAEHHDVEIHRFPDGETRVRLPVECAGKCVILVCGGHHPNTSALPLFFAAHAARAMGASRIGLVAPYLAYMRQDTAFHAGDAVSARAYGQFLSRCFDWIVTVDPHLHRIRSLDEIFSIPAVNMSSMPAMSDWIAANVKDPVIIGPDSESTQWASSVAQSMGVPWTVLHKIRTGDRQVSVSLPDPGLLRDRSPVIIDDIVSSGRTLVEAANGLRSLTSRPVTCVVVHALLAPEAEAAIKAAGVGRFVSTNTVAHASNAIDVVPLLAERIRALLPHAS